MTRISWNDFVLVQIIFKHIKMMILNSWTFFMKRHEDVLDRLIEISILYLLMYVWRKFKTVIGKLKVIVLGWFFIDQYQMVWWCWIKNKICRIHQHGFTMAKMIIQSINKNKNLFIINKILSSYRNKPFQTTFACTYAKLVFKPYIFLDCAVEIWF